MLSMWRAKDESPHLSMEDEEAVHVLNNSVEKIGKWMPKITRAPDICETIKMAVLI